MNATLLEGLNLLRAGEWDRSHRIAQADPTALGSWLHGIVHMAEPDESNSRYWYRQANRSFPGMAALTDEMAAIEAALTGAAG
jgi:argininosuccinate lyase